MRQQLVNPCVIFLNTKIARLKTQCFTHRKERVEHQLLWHHTQHATGMNIVGLHVVAMDQDAACSGLAKARQNTDERGFTGTVGA